MGIKFNKMNNGAKKGKVDYFNPVNGKNRIRLLGEVLPRYMYWVQGADKKVPVECLSFDREEERFDNSQPDPVKDKFPELNCNYSYVAQVYDYAEGKIKIFSFKKTVMDKVVDQISDPDSPFYGRDPADLEEGFDIVFTKKKTGPKHFNVDYDLDVLSMNNSIGQAPKEVLMVSDKVKPIEEIFPRPTVEDVEKQLQRIESYGQESENSDQAGEAVDELD